MFIKLIRNKQKWSRYQGYYDAIKRFRIHCCNSKNVAYIKGKTIATGIVYILVHFYILYVYKWEQLKAFEDALHVKASIKVKIWSFFWRFPTKTCTSYSNNRMDISKGLTRKCPEAPFIVPDWGDKVDYGVGLPYRPVRLHRLVRQPYTIVDYIPQ